MINFRTLFVPIFLSVVFSLYGCGQPPEPVGDNQNAPTEKTQIALVMKTLTNPFFISMEKGAQKAAKEFNVDLVVKTAAQETSINQQIDIVNQLVLDGRVSAIVIAPGDSIELIPVLKSAQDKGIKVVNIDNRLDAALSEEFGLDGVPFISVDNEMAAYKSAKFISDSIVSPTKVAILEGIPTAGNAQARKFGALRAFSENANASVVASKTAHWKVDEAYEVIKAIFQSEPNIGAIFCANDMMAIGVLKYLEDTGLNDLPVASFDAIDEAKDSIKAGKLTVTIDQQPAQQGYIGVKTAMDMLAGHTPPEELLVDVLVVSQAVLQ